MFIPKKWVVIVGVRAVIILVRKRKAKMNRGTCLNYLRTFTFDLCDTNFYMFDMVFMHLIQLT